MDINDQIKLVYLDSVIDIQNSKLIALNGNADISIQLRWGGVAEVLNQHYGSNLNHYKLAHHWFVSKLR